MTMMRCQYFTTFAIAFLAMCAGVASAQLVDHKPRFEAVEQAVGDVSPLSFSLRSLQTSLQLPGAFDGVFRVPGNDGGPDRYMRIDGAIAAIFPQSIYATTRMGELPLVPAGTVFHIGLPDRNLVQRERPQLRGVESMDPVPAVDRTPMVEYLSDQSLNESAPTPAKTSARQQLAHHTAAGAESNSAIDEADRYARLRALLRKAVAAENTNER
jgi:hypothetical protein